MKNENGSSAISLLEPSTKHSSILNILNYRIDCIEVSIVQNLSLVTLRSFEVIHVFLKFGENKPWKSKITFAY